MTETTNITTVTTPISESIVPPILQFLFGAGGNILAIVLLCCTWKSHGWRPFYRLVMGLAVTDLCGIIFVYPAVIAKYSSGFTLQYPKALCSHISFMFSFAFLASAFIVGAFSFDRFLAILFPFAYSTNKEKRTNITLIVIWLVSAFISALPIIGVGSVHNFYPGSWCFINFASNESSDKALVYIYSCVGILILIATVVFNLAVIFAVCVRCCKTTDGNVHAHRIKDDVYIVILLMGIVTVFSVCWVPLMVNITLCTLVQKRPSE